MPSGPQLETRLKRMVEARGGMCLKLVSPGYRGVTDRLVLWPGDRVAFVEIKGDGDRIRPEQARFRVKLNSRGFRCYNVECPEDVDYFCKLSFGR
jgi:hypothetical protein